MMYSPLVYPQTQEGQPYTRPETPSTFIAFFGSSPDWDPYSVRVEDRTEYWEDSVGTMSVEDVLLAIQGIDAIADQQNKDLTTYYETLINQDLIFVNEAGVSASYQADSNARLNLMMAIQGCMLAQTTPDGFFWVAADNTHVAMTYKDLLGLSAAIWEDGWEAFQHLQLKRKDIADIDKSDPQADTVRNIHAVVW